MTHPESLPQLLFTPMKLVGPETLAAWNPQWRGHVLRMDRRKVKLPAIILGCTAFNLAGRVAFLDLSYFICIYIILYIYIGCIGERDFDCCITIGCSIASIDSSRLFKLTNLKVHNQLYMCLILILSSNSFLNTIFCLQIECCEGIAVNYAVTKCSVSLHENPSGHLDGRIDCCQERQGGNCHSGDVWLITIWSWNRMKTSTFVSSIPDSRGTISQCRCDFNILSQGLLWLSHSGSHLSKLPCFDIPSISGSKVIMAGIWQIISWFQGYCMYVYTYI